MGFLEVHRPFTHGADSEKGVFIPPWLQDTENIRDDLAAFYEGELLRLLLEKQKAMTAQAQPPTGGPPMLPVLYNNHYQIVQSPGFVVILVEMNHDARIIRIGGERLPETIRPWLAVKQLSRENQ